MKIVYMGTPSFAVPALRALFENGQEIGYVVTKPDMQRDRGKKIKASPIKETAIELGLNILQPEKIKGNEEFIELLKGYAPDLIVVAAYGKIIPPEILEIPRCGCINIHGSVLPRWRGAAPIQRAVMNGDKTTGISLMYMAEGLDTGDVIEVSETQIGKKTSLDLHDELSKMGAELLIKNLKDIETGKANRKKQDDTLATHANMLSKKDGELDFSKNVHLLECEIRGLAPWPGAYTHINGDLLKIWEADEITIDMWNAEVDDKRLIGNKINEKDAKIQKNGAIVGITKDGIAIKTGDGILLAKEIQVAGKKKMRVEDYIRGHKIEIGTVLG